MSDPLPRPEADAAEIRRSKLIGRAIIVAFGLLLAAYFVPLAWTQIHGGW
ncbi:hypothetical protein [Phenylobacterium sp.]|nr:hypothetical protein [Phenylobacterium sp.]